MVQTILMYFLLHGNAIIHKEVVPDYYQTAKQMVQQLEKIKNHTDEDLEWLAMNIYFEARSENLHGRMVVAMVTLNRVVHPRWPNTIKAVIKQRKQFSWFNTRKVPEIKNQKAYEDCKKVASLCLELYNDYVDAEGFDAEGIAKGADHYFADYIDPPIWAKDMKFLGKVGRHLLYKS